jgi:cell division protease FtsH
MSKFFEKIANLVRAANKHKILSIFIILFSLGFAFWLVYAAGELNYFMQEKNISIKGSITYPVFIKDVSTAKNVKGSILIEKGEKAIFRGALGKYNGDYTIKGFSEAINNKDITLLNKKKVTISGAVGVIVKSYIPSRNQLIAVSIEDTIGAFLSGLMTIAFPLLMAAYVYFLFKSGSLGGLNSKKFSDARILRPNVKLSDVAGMEEVKLEISEIIDVLKNPKKYSDMNVRIPRGAILYGSPGNGKTLLAKAIAGEGNVPFISQSGSNFIELFVGQGARTVRRLFKEAREIAKKEGGCVIFIDEIDAIGGKRNKQMSMGHSEEKQTIDEILTQLDGFKDKDNVVVIAATNMLDSLDEALIRSGRFDRKIFVPSPGTLAREEILSLHMTNKKLAPDINVKKLAELSPGFSGADLENWINEASFQAIRRESSEVTMNDFNRSRDRILVGSENNGIKMNEIERRTTAYHEAGHAVVRLMTEGKVDRITIKPMGQALGVTFSVPNDVVLLTKEMIQQELQVLLGGRVAEELFIKSISNGASNDLERASAIAFNAVAKYGLSSEIGDYVPQTKEGLALADIAAKNMVMEQKDKTRELLMNNSSLVEMIAEKLLEKDIVDADEILKFKAEHTS